AEIAQDVAMLNTRTALVDKMTAKQNELKSAPSEKQNEIKKDIILLNPDTTLETKVAKLSELGMKPADIARALKTNQSEVRDEVSKNAKAVFQRLGGDVNNMPASIIVANAGAGGNTPALQ